jgi:hypothetical protein
MHQHALPARRRVVDEPGFLELEPNFGVEVVQAVFGGHLSLAVKRDAPKAYSVKRNRQS